MTKEEIKQERGPLTIPEIEARFRELAAIRPPAMPTAFDPARLPTMAHYFAPDVPQAERDEVAQGVVDASTVAGPIFTPPPRRI